MTGSRQNGTSALQQVQTLCVTYSANEVERLLDFYNPSATFTLYDATDCRHPALCDFWAKGDREKGKKQAMAAIVAQLVSLGEYSAKAKMDEYQMEELARIFVERFFYFNLAEVNVFFHRVKEGKYGTFYGAIDPMDIMSMAAKFETHRNQELDKRQQAQDREERAKARQGGISREAYLELVRTGKFKITPEMVREWQKL